MASWLRKREVGPWLVAAVVLCAFDLWLWFRDVPPVPDVAWLQEATRRWLGGARLYADIREINPPLIFYETATLSGAQSGNSAFVAGVAVATAISSLWVARHHGAMLGLGSFVAMTVPGMTEFGQREHLLLIFAIPYLLAKGSAVERTAMGLWAFLGVGLKPYFLLIVILPAIVEWWRHRPSLFDAQKLALGAACLAYVAAAFLVHPDYFREMVPLAQSVYTYGMPPPPRILLETVVLAGGTLLADKERRPLAAAVIGAILCFYIQGRFWPYHFIAAAGLGLLLFFCLRQFALWAAVVLLLLWQGPFERKMRTPIPKGVERVAVLSARPQDAYPAVSECGVTNVLPYASMGWVPGPWGIVSDPRSPAIDRKQAWAILAKERALLRRYIIANDAEVIIADVMKRKMYFDQPIDYMQFVGPLPGFRFVRKVGNFEIWAKRPISSRLCWR